MRNEKVFYIARHGATLDKEAGRHQSDLSPLSPTGRRQATLLGERALQLDFDTIIASPHLRARETAEAVQQVTGANIVYTDLLKERKKPGSIVGQPKEGEGVPEIYQAWLKSFLHNEGRVADGETAQDVMARAAQILDFLAHYDSSDRVFVIGHGAILRTALLGSAVLGADFAVDQHRNIQTTTTMANTGLSVYGFSGNDGWTQYGYNDTQHLASL